MGWETIDYQGVVSLERSLVQNLEKYLDKKETLLSRDILESIHPFPGETLPPPASYSLPNNIKLRDAVDGFSRKVRYIVENRRKIVPEEDWKIATEQLNRSLWSYVEILEGGVTELFQQVKQVGFEDWNFEMMNVVELIKDLLLQHLEDLIWAIKRIESRLWELRWDSEEKSGKNVFLGKVLSIGSSLLDKSLISSLEATEKTLKASFKTFITRYDNYFKIHNKIEHSSHKLKNYQVLNTLENPSRELYIKSYELLKLWNLNKKADIFPKSEVVRAIRNAFGVDKIYSIYEKYLNELKEVLFNKSREIKLKLKELFTGPVGKPLFDEEIEKYKAELHSLGALINQYREFLLDTNPNPYIRSRWGFTEWIVGPEPQQTKQLLNLIYDVESTEKLFNDLKNSVDESSWDHDEENLQRKKVAVENLLHEMEQPLISKMVMKSRAAKFIENMEEINELGSFDHHIVDFVAGSLSKAIRIDWQHHVLFDFSHFHNIYNIHQGIVGKQEDRKHMDRLNKFKELIDQIETWIKNRESHRHVHEIEQDMNDMKGYLQDFLGFVQRSVNPEMTPPLSIASTGSQLTQQLLEYRYLFGNFFNHLQKYQPEGKAIRQQFIFVDQYFESADEKIFSLKA